MRARLQLASLVIGLVAVMVAGCVCAGESTRRAVPEIEAATSLDFGQVAVGRTAELSLAIGNLGLGPIDVTDVIVEGAQADAFDATSSTLRLQPGASGELPLVFRPREAGEAAATLVLTSNDPEQPRVEVELRGEGLEPEFDVSPRTLDFGKVVLDTYLTREVTVTNLMSEPLLVDVGNIVPESDAPHFDVPLPDGPGRLEIPAGGSARLNVVYRPAGIGTHSGTFTLEACLSCAAISVDMEGEGIATGLQVEPDALDFGYAHPDRPLTKEVTFRNVGNVPVTVTEVGLSGPSGTGSADAAFTVTTPALPLELPPESEVPVPVHFTPPELTNHLAALVWRAPDTAVPSGVVLVLGEGGGPAITVSPEALDFGLTALAVPRERTLQISNEGHHPLTLKGYELVDGAAFEVVGDAAETVLAPLETVDWVVRYAPDSVGADLGTMRLLSDDPYLPELAVALKGEGIALPACAYSVAPEPLDFGTVARTHTLTLAIDVRNESEHEICLAGPFRLSEDTPPDFTLVDADEDGALPRMLLDPGERARAKVAFRPGTWGDFGGELVFEISDPGSPEGRVALTGHSTSSSITVSPTTLDFGEVEAPCHHARRVFCVTNNGSEGAMITGVAVAEGPDAGNFALVEIPAALTGTGEIELTPGSEECLAVHFIPRDDGIHLGAVRLDYKHPSEADGASFSVGLTGSGMLLEGDSLVQNEGCLHGRLDPRMLPCNAAGMPADFFGNTVDALVHDAEGALLYSGLLDIDAFGYFSLPGLPVGEYLVVLSHGGREFRFRARVLDQGVTILAAPPARGPGRLAYVSGWYDGLEVLLDRLVPSTSTIQRLSVQSLLDASSLSEFGAIFLNCGLPSQVYTDTAIVSALRDFVRAGGNLYLSHGANMVAVQAWPEAVDLLSQGAVSEEGLWISGSLDDDLGGAIGASEIDLFFFEMDLVLLADGALSAFYSVRSLIEGNVAGEDQAPLMACFQDGLGYVVLTSFHHDIQPQNEIDSLMATVLYDIFFRAP